MQSKLLARTQELVASSPLRATAIAEGTGLPLKWVYTFVHGRCEKPNVVYVERLYEFLSGKKLDV